MQISSRLNQGYSEHQLGTAFDLTTPELVQHSPDSQRRLPTNGLLKMHTSTASYFLTLRTIPTTNLNRGTGDLWGIALATELHDTNEYFYDLDQRDINSYLANIFDLPNQ